jgi:hypothetical protein
VIGPSNNFWNQELGGIRQTITKLKKGEEREQGSKQGKDVEITGPHVRTTSSE